MKIIALTLTLFFIGHAFAQKPGHGRIDSLQEVLKTSKPDTTKINTLNALANELSNSDPDTAISYSNRALQLAKETGWQLGVGKSYHSLGRLYYFKGNYPISLEHYAKALAIYDALEKSGGVVKSQLLILK